MVVLLKAHRHGASTDQLVLAGAHLLKHVLEFELNFFMQSYGKELEEAYEWLQKFRRSRKEAELHQAWDLYYHVFKRINKQLPQLTVLELHYVSPALASAEVFLSPLSPLLQSVMAKCCHCSW